MNTDGFCAIQMDGEEVALKFGIPACRIFIEKITQGHVEPISGDSINEVGAAYLVYAGYYNHCIIHEKQPVKTFADIMAWIEARMGEPELHEQLQIVADCYGQSTTVRKFIEQMDKSTEAVKKKLTGILSNPSATAS